MNKRKGDSNGNNKQIHKTLSLSDKITNKDGCHTSETTMKRLRRRNPHTCQWNSTIIKIVHRETEERRRRKELEGQLDRRRQP